MHHTEWPLLAATGERGEDPAQPSVNSFFLIKKNTGVGCHSLLQGIFLTQGSNPHLLHSRQIYYCLSYQGSPSFMQQRSNLAPSSNHESLSAEIALNYHVQNSPGTQLVLNKCL